MNFKLVSRPSKLAEYVDGFALYSTFFVLKIK